MLRLCNGLRLNHGWLEKGAEHLGIQRDYSAVLVLYAPSQEL